MNVGCQRLKIKVEGETMASITISREYGSLAEELSFRVCKILGYKYFDKSHIIKVAEEAGLSDKELLDMTVDEMESKNLFQNVATNITQVPVAGYSTAGTLVNSSSTMTTFMNFHESLDMEKAASMIQTILHAVVKKGEMVITGRGGQALFQDNPDVIHVRVIAPLAKRVENVMKQQDVDENEAKKIIKKHDNTAADYLRKTYKIDWSDPTLYHLVINTDKVDFDKAARMIADLV